MVLSGSIGMHGRYWRVLGGAGFIIAHGMHHKHSFKIVALNKLITECITLAGDWLKLFWLTHPKRFNVKNPLRIQEALRSRDTTGRELCHSCKHLGTKVLSDVFHYKEGKSSPNQHPTLKSSSSSSSSRKRAYVFFLCVDMTQKNAYAYAEIAYTGKTPQ